MSTARFRSLPDREDSCCFPQMADDAGAREVCQATICNIEEPWQKMSLREAANTNHVFKTRRGTGISAGDRSDTLFCEGAALANRKL